MGLIAIIREVGQVEGPQGQKYRELKVNVGGGVIKTAKLFAVAGDDAAPMVGDFAHIEETGRSGQPTAVATLDDISPLVTQPGERRLYSRRLEGETNIVVADQYLKLDGTIISVNYDNGGAVLSSIEQKPDGTITLTTPAGPNVFNPDGSVDFSNGAKLDDAGDYISATGISLNNHTHTSQGPGNPTTPPIP